MAAPIYVLLLSLFAAEARLQEEGGRCMAVQQRLAQLRAEIEEVEEEAALACSAGTTPVSALPSVALVNDAAGVASAGLALPATPSLPDGASTKPGGRRRQTSGTVTQIPRSVGSVLGRCAAKLSRQTSASCVSNVSASSSTIVMVSHDSSNNSNNINTNTKKSEKLLQKNLPFTKL